jgi:hypothetical protein
VSIVTIGERQLQSNENSHVRKKVSCPIADIGELTQSTLSGHSHFSKRSFNVSKSNRLFICYFNLPKSPSNLIIRITPRITFCICSTSYSLQIPLYDFSY